MSTTRDAETKALQNFMQNNPSALVSRVVWEEAFREGSNYGERKTKAECVCNGKGSVQVEGSGWCTCPRCSSFVHLLGEGGRPLCEMILEGAAVFVEDAGSATCAYCLHKLIRDEEDTCTVCGDHAGPNICNGCR